MKFGNKNYYPTERFVIPEKGKEYESPYDMSSAMLQDLIGRNQGPFDQFTLNLATAGYLAFSGPAYAIVAYGWETNSPNVRTVNTTAFMKLYLEEDPGTTGVPGVPNNSKPFFPMKHARGFRGPFVKGFLYWTAQAGVSVDVILHKFKDHPWIDGESAT